jgi:hypothetical protein
MKEIELENNEGYYNLLLEKEKEEKKNECNFKGDCEEIDNMLKRTHSKVSFEKNIDGFVSMERNLNMNLTDEFNFYNMEDFKINNKFEDVDVFFDYDRTITDEEN